MIVDAKIDPAWITRAVEALGGAVTWPDSTPKTVRTEVKVSIVEETVAEQLADRGWFADDEVSSDHADPGDVRDFVVACGRGDVMIAGALASRLFSSDANIAAIERGLHERRPT